MKTVEGVRTLSPGHLAEVHPVCVHIPVGCHTCDAGRLPDPRGPCSRCVVERSPAPQWHAHPPGHPSAPDACCGSCRKTRVSINQPNTTI